PAGITLPAVSGGMVQARQAGNVTVWSAPAGSASGKKYLFIAVVPIHREQHTWFEDLYHFASPQLPVAIAVGGLTTFVLVLIFTRPVVRLRKAALQLAQGNLSTRVPEAAPRSRFFKGDEFDALVHSFNHMAERLEPLRHVVETVHESVELIALEESASRRGFGDAGAQIALCELQGGLTQANHRASENEHQNKGCESADCNGYGQL